jgi:hypothetical protein
MATKRLHLSDDDGNEVSLDAIFDRIADEQSSRFKDAITQEFSKMVNQATKARPEKTARKRKAPATEDSGVKPEQLEIREEIANFRRPLERACFACPETRPLNRFLMFPKTSKDLHKKFVMADASRHDTAWLEVGDGYARHSRNYVADMCQTSKCFQWHGVRHHIFLSHCDSPILLPGCASNGSANP